MIRYQRLPGVRLGGTSNPRIVVTEEGRAMGFVPGWQVLLDPDHLSADGSLARNRARHNSWAEQIPAEEINIGSFGGVSGFHATDNENIRLRPNDVPINPEVWSVVTVAQVVSTPATQRILATDSAVGGEINMRVVIQSNGQQARVEETSDAGTSRISYDHDFTIGPSLLIYTFSTRDGLKIFSNGELVASNASDKRPLTAGYAAGEWSCFRSGRGHFGVTALLDIDLGWPEHAGYRRAIERFLMDKYGIS